MLAPINFQLCRELYLKRGAICFLISSMRTCCRLRSLSESGILVSWIVAFTPWSNFLHFLRSPPKRSTVIFDNLIDDPVVTFDWIEMWEALVSVESNADGVVRNTRVSERNGHWVEVRLFDSIIFPSCIILLSRPSRFLFPWRWKSSNWCAILIPFCVNWYSSIILCLLGWAAVVSYFRNKNWFILFFFGAEISSISPAKNFWLVRKKIITILKIKIFFWNLASRGDLIKWKLTFIIFTRLINICTVNFLDSC